MFSQRAFYTMRIEKAILLMIAVRVAYFFAIQGPHDGLYFIQMANLKDIFWLLIAASVFKSKWFCGYAAVFSLLMLYPFMPEAWRDTMLQGIWALNCICFFVVFGLVLRNMIKHV